MKLNQKANRLIGRAMHDYQMLADRDRVMVAVSGGVDSLVLLAILRDWQLKAPIKYELLAVHLDMGFGVDQADLVTDQLARLGVEYLVEKTDIGPRALEDEEGRSGCFHCARRRRNRLFEIAHERNFTKIAMGHHKEDIIETFFLNMMYGGNLSTMVPRQDLFAGKLSLIRPMSYFEKAAIREIAAELHAQCGSASKELQTIPGADHNNILQVTGRLFYEVIDRFCRKVGRPARRKKSGVR
jgi:tRNA 2-thiocytidine biosynthesis protein TtcA